MPEGSWTSSWCPGIKAASSTRTVAHVTTFSEHVVAGEEEETYEVPLRPSPVLPWSLVVSSLS